MNGIRPSYSQVISPDFSTPPSLPGVQYQPYLDTNPWAYTLQNQQTSLNRANQAAGGIDQSMQNLQGQIQKGLGMAGYPTFPNEFGIGSQQPFQQAATQQPTQASQPQPISANRGFNPWSLQGEALSR